MSATIEDLIENDIDSALGDNSASWLKSVAPDCYRALENQWRCVKMAHLDNSAEGAD